MLDMAEEEKKLSMEDNDEIKQHEDWNYRKKYTGNRGRGNNGLQKVIRTANFSTFAQIDAGEMKYWIHDNGRLPKKEQDVQEEAFLKYYSYQCKREC